MSGGLDIALIQTRTQATAEAATLEWEGDSRERKRTLGADHRDTLQTGYDFALVLDVGVGTAKRFLVQRDLGQPIARRRRRWAIGWRNLIHQQFSCVRWQANFNRAAMCFKPLRAR